MCREFYIEGRVQGVFFRASTARVANRLGLRGEARNLSDGRVRVIACGGTDELTQLESWLHEGSPMSRVDRVLVSNLPDHDWEQYPSFTTA